MNKAESDYVKYLETKVCTQAYRIGQLEAVLLYVLNLRDHKHNPDMVYIKATAALHEDFSFSQETTDNYKQLLNG